MSKMSRLELLEARERLRLAKENIAFHRRQLSDLKMEVAGIMSRLGVSGVSELNSTSKYVKDLDGLVKILNIRLSKHRIKRLAQLHAVLEITRRSDFPAKEKSNGLWLRFEVQDYFDRNPFPYSKEIPRLKADQILAETEISASKVQKMINRSLNKPRTRAEVDFFKMSDGISKLKNQNETTNNKQAGNIQRDTEPDTCRS